MLTTVKVPEQFVPIFEKAQEYVGRYFKEKEEDPTKGTIEIFDERYILVRAASMSVEFFETVAKLYEKEGEEEAQNIARQMLFDIAHAIGKQDAKNFYKKMNLKDPIEKFATGPVHFSHSGWAFVDIFPESRPSPDENFLLIYDHPYAFESAAWLASGRKSTFPVCIMNSGYSSGWCEESFGVTLVASEIMCVAKGDPACRFIMAPPSRIEGHIADYIKKEPETAKSMTRYEIPGFFKRKEMEEALRKSEAEWRHTFDSISDFVSIHDKNFRILKVNKSLADFLGMTPEEIVGKHCYELLHGKTEPWPICPHTATLQSGNPETREVNDPRIGRTLLVTTSPMFDENNQVIGSVHVAKDITERRKMEDERDRLLEEAGKINKELNDFAYIISHDLKAPLRGIMQLSQWIAEDFSDRLDDEGKNKLSLLTERAKRMHDMIDGVLQYSRAGRMTSEAISIDAGSMIRQSVDLLSPPSNVSIKVQEGLPKIHGDPVKVSQVFQNLIGNAIRYMDKPQGLVEVGCRDAGDSWEFFVQDNGPGIEERHFERIFQMFQFLKKEEESTGIGLPIAKKIVEQHGGRIWVESKAGMGSTFRFTWPKK